MKKNKSLIFNNMARNNIIKIKINIEKKVIEMIIIKELKLKVFQMKLIHLIYLKLKLKNREDITQKCKIQKLLILQLKHMKIILIILMIIFMIRILIRIFYIIN